MRRSVAHERIVFDYERARHRTYNRRPIMSFISAAEADKNTYDVIVVGSGAAGGQTAYTLTMEGARVLMLEAGRNYEPATETPMMQTNGEAPLRGSGTPEKPFGFWDATIDGGWEVPGEPYTSASDDPARKFVWWRARMLGGRTNHWGRITLRNGPYDFKPHTRDGLGFDWPMSYEDLAPYYDKVEMLIGVYGANDGLENTPNSSPGVLAAAAQAARQRPAHPAARAQARHSRDRRSSRRAHAAARPQAAAETAASGQCQGAADPRRRHAEARRVFLRHALRPRLLDPG